VKPPDPLIKTVTEGLVPVSLPISRIQFSTTVTAGGYTGKPEGIAAHLRGIAQFVVCSPRSAL